MDAERAAELLSRLNARVQHWGVPTDGSFGALCANDFAAALGMIKVIPPAVWLLRIKYAGQIQWRESFEAQIVAEIERGALGQVAKLPTPADRWIFPRKDFLRDMCRLALFECAIDTNRCQRCKGRGQFKRRKGGANVNCERCGGTGVGKRRDDWRARVLGIDVQEFMDHWKDRYEAVKKLLAYYEELALRATVKRLRRG